MRLAIVGAGGARKTETAIARAAAHLGLEVYQADVARRKRRWGRWGTRLLARRLMAFDPDFVLVTRHAIGLGADAVERLVRGRQSAFWYFDLQLTERVIELGRLAGATYLTCAPLREAATAAGMGNVRFMPQAMDPWYDYAADSAPASYRCDFSFVGSGQYPDRHNLLRAIAQVGKLQIRGSGWHNAPTDLPVVGGPVYGRAFTRVVHGASISLGASAFREQQDELASASNRMWKILGCGGFYLGAWAPGIEQFARSGEHCIWYHDIDEAVQLAKQYLGRPDERARIAAAGRQHALAEHTYAHRLKLILAGREYPIR
ncbi:MAG TPA: glycosyltransferase [Gemmatimonadales bacterium]|nr:glycosyltransferase [Gemmatimonadales bacterium]